MSFLKFLLDLFFLNMLNRSLIIEAYPPLQYLNHTCSTNKIFTPNSSYQFNLHTLLTTLSSHSATTQFLNTTTGVSAGWDTIYGMFMCRGDVTNQTCQTCISVATDHIASLCPYSKEAIIWYHECLIRYSNQSFFSVLNEWPRLNFGDYNLTANSTSEKSYAWVLANTLSYAVAEAANAGPAGIKKFATRRTNVSKSQSVYTLVQCTNDLSSGDCNKCLGNVMRDLPMCCLKKDEGMVLNPSCSLMFCLEQYYRDVGAPPAHTSPTTFPDVLGTEESTLLGKQILRSRKIILSVVLIVLLVMFFCARRFRRIKALRRYKAILKEYFGNESTTLESLQFDLATIEAATNKFSYENLIGKGGFGEVYKGTLPDGREVAVKRLSRTSAQGAAEFTNEVLLIAKLQHRNLVALLGFCLQDGEKILIYDFVPNKSLDHFLFDPEKQRALSWCDRFKIIGGIAQAILYLHEYSRLKVIHRDIKPSNILLDDNLNAKVSDFGMARMVAVDQDPKRTNRIVGT